jgi:secernin
MFGKAARRRSGAADPTGTGNTTNTTRDQKMGSDTVVALPRATANGRTLFGHNSNCPGGDGSSLVRAPGRAFELGETVHTPYVALPQVRRTHTVLAGQSSGQWGYEYGVNDCGVAVGATPYPTRLVAEEPGLAGPDLVRLTLERAAGARQAIDLLADLVGRHGQGGYTGRPGDGPDRDPALLVADAAEAYVFAACGRHWVVQEVGAVRALGEVCHLRQDWDRLSRGLSDLAIARGWWPEDGSKLDFAGAMCPPGHATPGSLRRWARATVLLEERHGDVDAPFLRHLLGDHFNGCPDEIDPWGQPPYAVRPDMAAVTTALPPLPLCQHARDAAAPGTAVSLVVELAPPPEAPLVWCAFGPPCTSVYFPLSLDAELPIAFRSDAPWQGPHRLRAEGVSAGTSVRQRMQSLHARLRQDPRALIPVREMLAGLQTRFDQVAREFRSEAAVLCEHSAGYELERLAGSFMQHNVERFEEVWDALPVEHGLRSAPRSRRVEEFPIFS